MTPTFLGFENSDGIAGERDLAGLLLPVWLIPESRIVFLHCSHRKTSWNYASTTADAALARDSRKEIWIQLPV